MARRANGRLRLEIDIKEEVDSLGVGDAIARMDHQVQLLFELLNGTADGQIDRVLSASGNATTTAIDFDLQGAITSPLNAQAITMTEVVGFFIQNTGVAGTDPPLRVGGDPNGIPWAADKSDAALIPAGGCMFFYAGPAGIAVTAGTGDIIQIFTGSGDTDFKLIVFGRSA